MVSWMYRRFRSWLQNPAIRSKYEEIPGPISSPKASSRKPKGWTLCVSCLGMLNIVIPPNIVTKDYADRCFDRVLDKPGNGLHRFDFGITSTGLWIQRCSLTVCVGRCQSLRDSLRVLVTIISAPDFSRSLPIKITVSS